MKTIIKSIKTAVESEDFTLHVLTGFMVAVAILFIYAFTF